MNDAPRLIAVSGPLQGQIWPLSETEITIGRDTTNHICIKDVSASRRHCLIRKEADEFKIFDLESMNGTFVDDVPVKERALTDGSQIEVGSSTFIFLLKEPEGVQPSFRISFSEGMVTKSTIRLSRADSTYVHPEKLSNVLTSPRVARDLQCLLNISHTIQAARKTADLFSKVVELALQAIPAERGVILLWQNKQLLPAYTSNQETRPISKKVARDVIQDRTGVLSNELSDDSGACAVLCVPMVALDRTFGVMYFDSRVATRAFVKEDLDLLTAVGNMLGLAWDKLQNVEWLEAENRRLQAEHTSSHNMIGESRAMRAVYDFIDKAAPTDSTVLIQGESGTGKELVARAIHSAGSRSTRPFVAINCALLSDTLLESELFGHEKGAFTGAIAQKKGKFEIADTGTVFLDEITEMSPALQAKLLRVLQEREFERVGGTSPIRVDIRVVAATNKNLKEEVARNTFRTDLFYRLNVLSISMPRLRDRADDIPLLANYFVSRFSKKFKRRLNGISPDARLYMMNYDWPGNVRELENAVERAVVLGSSETIFPEDLPESILETTPPSSVNLARYHESVSDAKKRIIEQALDQASNNITAAAKLLGLQPTYLHRLLRNLGIKK